jgi:nanoRNase/pAp phosphatase (c-di-AMP/oligoRNAs hydrolase)
MSKSFKDLLGKQIVVLGHHNADPDAIGAAVGIKELVETLSPTSVVTCVMPADVSALSERIFQMLGLEIREKYNDPFDSLIIVDTGSLKQLGDWEETVRESGFNLLVIDHHNRNSEYDELSDFYLIDEEAGSTSEQVQRLFKEYDLEPSITTAKALLAGITFDSKFFSIGSAQTYQSVSELLEITGDISSTRELFNSTIQLPEKIARIKAAQRTETHQINGWIIALSRLGSYQSSGARALISIGADVAVVTGEDKGDLRASLRSTQRFHDKTAIHLGNLISEASETLDGQGNGHPTAAGYNGSGDIDEFHSKILALIKKKLG